MTAGQLLKMTELCRLTANVKSAAVTVRLCSVALVPSQGQIIEDAYNNKLLLRQDSS